MIQGRTGFLYQEQKLHSLLYNYLVTRKRRSETQIMEEQSITLLKSILPESWVLHEYGQDYGIDFVVEVFKDVIKNKIPKNKLKSFETTGSNFYIQLKAVKKLKKVTVKKYPRNNVEKTAFEELDTNETPEIFDVVRFSLDVPLINTVLAMGNAAPVLLFVADLSENKIYFVCLNDYAEKILYPQNFNFRTKKKAVIEIPIDNVIDPTSQNSFKILSFYAQRAKYYAAFTKFNYHKNEVGYTKNLVILKRFLEVTSRYDLWTEPTIWSMIPYIKSAVDNAYSILEKAINKNSSGDSLLKEELSQTYTGQELEFHMQIKLRDVYTVWHHLGGLGNVYEECVREWFLPTYLGRISSYPA